MVIERAPVHDERGTFERLFDADKLAAAKVSMIVAQANRSVTVSRGTIRGLHFQRPPHTETKLVSCLNGRIFDVAVDLRPGSPSFLGWHAEELSESNHRSLLIPAGFAHGLQALEDNCHVLYLHSAPYVPSSEDGISALDPKLRIAWPITVGEMSERDRGLKVLSVDFRGVEV
jgi:dTDP-4-dehydrorhamnose 3,5-epimerase